MNSTSEESLIFNKRSGFFIEEGKLASTILSADM